MTAAHKYFIDTQVAALLGIQLEDIPFAMRRGDLPIPVAHTIHGQPLWDADTVAALVEVTQ